MIIVLKLKKQKRACKLSNEQMFQVVKKYCNRDTTGNLAMQYNVTTSTIVNIINKVFKASFAVGFTRECMVRQVRNAKIIRYEEF